MSNGLTHQEYLFRSATLGKSVWPAAVSKYAEKEDVRQCQGSDKYETSMQQQGDKPLYSSRGTKMFVWDNRIMYTGSSILRAIHAIFK